jgi:uncharacterized Zn finger protein
MSYWGSEFMWAPRKTVAQRRAEAERKIKDAARRGKAKSPIAIAGRKIAQTFWGTAWCDNLERYRDFAYRLERGRSYVRSGSVIHLQIETGKIAAEVLGSSLYQVTIEIDAVQRAAWKAIQRDCAGAIGSRLDLLSGRLSDAVMTRLCAEKTGLFPAPSAIRFTCSCPDYAVMCKHVAATMYGVGARLDDAPEMLFTLRRVALDELLASAVSELPSAPTSGRVLAAGGLASLFGIELADPTATAATASAAKAKPKPKPTREAAGKAKSKAKPKTSRQAGSKAKPAVTRTAKKVDKRTKPAPARARAKPASPGRRRDK